MSSVGRGVHLKQAALFIGLGQCNDKASRHGNSSNIGLLAHPPCFKPFNDCTLCLQRKFHVSEESSYVTHSPTGSLSIMSSLVHTELQTVGALSS